MTDERLTAYLTMQAIMDVTAELDRARSRFPEFHSSHEGYAIILEEIRELEAEVFGRPGNVSYERMDTEAMQIAAMAIRFMVDVCRVNM